MLDETTVTTLLPDQHARLQRLLDEAQTNARVPRNGVKPPRDILKVLLGSGDFEYTDPRDTFYAALGMCNVQTSASRDDQPKMVWVDYNKTFGEVYTDATIYIMSRHESLSDLETLWNNLYHRTPLHSKDLSTWAIDWRSDAHSRADNAFQILTDKTSRSRQTDRTAHDSWKDDKIGYNVRRPLLDNKRLSNKYEVKKWHRPEPLPMNRSTLRFRVRILNYVAHLTDYTCHPSNFQCPASWSDVFKIGAASRFVHASRAVHQSAPWFSSLPPHPTKFEQGIHSWRIAILGVADTRQICMVPPSAKKGDLVVAVTPGLLPMLIRPTKYTSAAAGLYGEHDSNENLSHDEITESRLGHPVRLFPIWQRILVALGGCILVLNSCICLSAFEFNGTTFTLPMIGLSAVPAFLLFGHLICTYVYVHSECFDCHRSSQDPPVFLESCVSLCTICSFPIGILVLKGLSCTALGVCFASTLTILISSDPWRFCSLKNHEIPLLLRRQRVRELLDTMVDLTGPDYEFHGPLTVPKKSDFPEFSKLGHYLSWCGYDWIPESLTDLVD